MGRPTARDAVVAAVAVLLVTAGSIQAARGQQPPRALDGWAYALLVVAAGGLAWRQTAPLAVLAGSVVASGAYLLLGYPYGPVLLCVGAAMFEVARRCPPGLSAAVGAVAALVSVATVLPRLMGQLSFLAAGLALWAGCWLAVPWALGVVVRLRRQAVRDLVARAALEERVRVAREVHDVAGHGFAVIAMQAGVALVVLEERPEQVRTALEAIRATSGDALRELRQVLDQRVPAAELSLESLIGRARGAGLDVKVTAVDLPPAPAALAYRVVRESLTNVLRHAGPAKAQVSIERAGGDVLVTVADDGAGPDPHHELINPPRPDDPGSPGPQPERTGFSARGEPAAEGRGIAGMRGAVEAAGGRLDAGPEPGGGFVVRAVFPVGAGT